MRRPLIIGTIVGMLLTFMFVQPASAAPDFRALLFTKTAGYRHDSIPAGVAMFQQQATANNFELVHSEDANVFTPANLATFDVLVMFQTSGMVWTSAAQRQAVEGYLASGKGIVAIHNATDMGIENEYPWWDQTINARRAHARALPRRAARHRHRRRQEAPVDGQPAGPLEP